MEVSYFSRESCFTRNSPLRHFQKVTVDLETLQIFLMSNKSSNIFNLYSFNSQAIHFNHCRVVISLDVTKRNNYMIWNTASEPCQSQGTPNSFGRWHSSLSDSSWSGRELWYATGAFLRIYLPVSTTIHTDSQLMKQQFRNQNQKAFYHCLSFSPRMFQ